jgi:mycothiol synthase
MQTPIRETYLIRPAAQDDLEAVVELINAHAQALTGTNDIELDDLRNEWSTSNFSLEDSTRVVVSPDGEIAGYVEVWDNIPIPVRVWVWGRVRPQYQGQGIGTQLMDWAENRARQAIDRAPAEAQVVVECGALSTNQSAHDLFRDRGMTVSRHFYTMRIDMETAPAEPVWPQGITVRTVVMGENERAAILAADDSFRDHWGHVDMPEEAVLERWLSHIRVIPNFDSSLWFVAMDGDEIAGVSFCWPTDEGNSAIGHVGTLGVRRPWRRIGLGMALLQHSFGELWRRGKRSVTLGVDASSLTGATRLYERAGMYIYRRYDNYRKVLRPGIDLTTQNVHE